MSMTKKEIKYLKLSDEFEDNDIKVNWKLIEWMKYSKTIGQFSGIHFHDRKRKATWYDFI